MRRKRILVVDDNPVNLEIFEEMLGSEYIVLSAQDGAEALHLAEQYHPRAVLLDVMLPGMDGYETTRAIRAEPEFRALPIIALTAKAMRGDREKCLEAGASDYLAKPVDTDQLLGMLKQWMYR